MPTVTKRKTIGSRVPAGPTGTVRRYIESSALVAGLLEGDSSARASMRARGERVTSALTFAEADRAIVRARVAGRISTQQERSAKRSIRSFRKRCFIAKVTEEVLDRAGKPFPVEPVRTLDAIHLATVESLLSADPGLLLVTRDERVRQNALALGLVVE